VTATPLHRASDQERERLVADFIRFCEIESPSGRERAMADAVAADLREMGLDVEEDDTGPETGSDAGNILARVPGPEGARAILLCAHIDTVPLDASVEVTRENGVLTNRHEAILGADNKAAVATVLGAVRRLVLGGSPLELELLFTTCEERALRGAKAFPRGRLRSEFGFVFDHASPIGEIVVASPTYYRLESRFRGRAAHAGIRPEAGRNAIAAAGRAIAAMRIGRLDDETTANVGRIEGGTSANVVAERCSVEFEARSLDDARAGEVVSEMVDAAAEAASDADCDVETSVERMFRGYRLPRTAPPVEAAAAALRERGIEPTYIATGGGSDANAFVAAGLPVVNIANGTERNHQPDESVTVDALETMLDVTLALVAASA
jgi:tripeptide aminopeptidase